MDLKSAWASLPSLSRATGKRHPAGTGGRRQPATAQRGRQGLHWHGGITETTRRTGRRSWPLSQRFLAHARTHARTPARPPIDFNRHLPDFLSTCVVLTHATNTSPGKRRRQPCKTSALAARCQPVSLPFECDDFVQQFASNVNGYAHARTVWCPGTALKDVTQVNLRGS